MPAPTYTDDDFTAGFLNLFPTGPVWPREPDSVLGQTAAALIKSYTRNAASAAALLEDAMPIAPVMMLPEWEKSLGLPDPCAGPSPTLQVRQRQVNARFVASGGQSCAYFISVAASLGYDITIDQFAPARFGQPFGQPMYGDPWAFAWRVNAPTYEIKNFSFGRDEFGEAFQSWGNTVLQCELQRLAPAHTVVIFDYS